MIILDSILHSAINPALLLLPRAMDSDAARVMLLTAGLQESKFEWRYQRTSIPYVKGPARGFWQNERGGVFCLMTNDATKGHLQVLCAIRKVSYDQVLIHARLEFDDVLAAGCARLLLWADPHPLPLVDASHDATWDYYIRCWKPGKPRRETWDAHHARARAQVLS